MRNYLIIIEKTNKNYSAYAPDLDGCVATGSTIEEVKENMQLAIEIHIKGLIEDGLPVPEPSVQSAYAKVS